MNIQEEFKPWINEIKKEYITENNVINSKRLVPNAFKKIFPDAYNIIEQNYKNHFREILYCIFRDIREFPICPICGNKITTLRNFVVGFQKTCSKECGMKSFRSEDSIKKMSLTKTKQGINAAKNRFHWLNDNDIEPDKQDRNYLTIKNYCIHGDARVYKRTLTKVYNISEDGITYCIECNKNIYETYNPTQEEINVFVNKFKEFYDNNAYRFSKQFWFLYYPKKLKIIKIYYETYFDKFNLDDINCLHEAYYVLYNKLTSRPICKHEDCNNTCEFHGTQYSVFCKDHGIGYNCSGKEYDLESFIKTFNKSYKHNDRSLINKELDFYFPNNKIAIEFNGCWYHCDRFKDKNYHFDKFNKCLEKGVQLISIWEDDWIDKQDLIEDFIKAKLGIFEHKIGARECEIKEVSIQDSRIFLDNNHLQGYCNAKYRYGLYYNNELVEMMTFGNSRFKKGELELLRMCSKRSWNIIGGASKLFKYFLNHVEDITEVISYANCDISIGDVYNKLGFKYVHTTENWSWLYNGKRINRFNKIRFKEDELELYKCYSSGTMKFIYKNNQN